jgi:diguanylate cyclase (GGDEF)-like protein
MPELGPFAEAFNLALTGDDDTSALAVACDELVQRELDASTVIRITTLLAVIFSDEVGATSGAVTKSLVETLGDVCGLLSTTMVANISELAHRDFLTALENRRAWDARLAGDIQSGNDVTVAMIDLDGLKRINDTDGHIAGDSYLKRFAADLVRALPNGATAYRLAGDEYGVRWPGDYAEALLSVLTTLDASDDVAPFSFGVGRYPHDAQDSDSLIKVADERMYELKRTRKAAPEAATTSNAGAAGVLSADDAPPAP